MAISGDVVAGAVTRTWQHLMDAVPGGWARREDGALAAVTTVPVSSLNVVFVDQLDAGRGTVAALLDAVAASALPHCLQLRPGSDPALSELAVERGMKPAVDVPVMALENSSRLDRLAGTTDDLVINVLPPEEADRHVSVVAAGFEAPEELFVQLMTPSVLSLPGARAYVGYLGYEPVTTAFSVTLGEGVGIFNVATPPAFRRRGYGAAVTARAARDGLRDGAQWAWLQSSPAGYGVYQRLGFRPLESWACWIAGIN